MKPDYCLYYGSEIKMDDLGEKIAMNGKKFEKVG